MKYFFVQIPIKNISSTSFGNTFDICRAAFIFHGCRLFQCVLLQITESIKTYIDNFYDMSHILHILLYSCN